MKKKIYLLFFLLLFFLTGGPQAMAGETISDAKIKVEVHHLVVSQEGGVLRAFESIRYNNTGTETYVGSKNSQGQVETLKISLPLGYQDLQFVSGITNNDVKPIQNGVALEMPIPPGAKEIAFTYTIPADPESTAILKTFYYDTQEFYFLTPLQGSQTLGLAGQELFQGPNVNIDGTQYKQVYTQNVVKNKKLTFLAIAPTSARAASSKVDFHSPGHIERWLNSPLAGTNPHLWLVFIGVLALGIVVALILLRRQKKLQEAPNEEFPKAPSMYKRLEIKKRILLEKIMSLEEDYRQGLLDEDEFKRKREGYKELIKKTKLKMEVFEEG